MAATAGARGAWTIGFAGTVVLGGLAGVAAHTFLYADGHSYLFDDPASCANCHVMRDHFDAWVKSSHHAIATCNDCHTPHGSPVAKLWTKALNGFNHSRAFTTGDFAEPIRMTARNRAVTEGACRACHVEIVQAIDHAPREGRALDCIRCHSGVGHP